MVTISKIEHRGNIQIFLKFEYSEDIISKIKYQCQAKYSKTYQGWYIEYTKESWAKFIQLGLKYEIENSGTAGCAEPLSVHTGEKIADVPQPCTEKAADTTPLSIKYFHPYFYVKGIMDELMIQELKLLPKTYWNAKYGNWVAQANKEALDLFHQKWKIIDENQRDVWNQQIALISNPPICILYSSPQYPDQVLIQLKGIGVDVDFLKHITQRTYNTKDKFWLIPHDDKNIKRIIEHYTSFKTKIINRLKSVNKVSSELTIGERRAYLINKIPENLKLLMASYIDTLIKERYSWKTITSYSSSFKRYAQHILPSKCHEKTEVDVNKYLCSIAESNVSDSVMNTHINAIKFYYQKVEYLPNFKLERIKRPRPSQSLPKVLSVQEVDRMLRSLQNIKHICLLACIYGHGLRLGEVRNIKMEDVKWDRNQIFISKGKGSPRWINKIVTETIS
jgi:integrase